MTALIIVLLVLWLAISVIGAVVEGLLWLLFIGVILIVATAIFGWVKRKARSGS